jgi:4-amino-4-deoxy-L-arabinose transferase-like glycosyltransferase
MKYRFLIVSVFLFTLLLFYKNNQIVLWEQDESAYAGFAHTMLKTGNWVTPDFEWSEPHRKTPFHFWTIACAYQLFGENEFATRLPSCLCILGTVLSLFFLGRRLFSTEIAQWSAIVLMLSILPLVFAKIALTDAALLFCTTLAYFLLQLYLKTNQIRYFIGLLVIVSIGLLVKGPPILITVGGTVLLKFLFDDEKIHSFKMGLLLFLTFIPLLVWGRIAWVADGGVFIQWLLDWYIFKRTSGSVFGQTGPFGYYFGIFSFNFILLLPYFFKSTFDIFRNYFKKSKDAVENGFHRINLYWILCGWIFYECLPSKLPAYALAAIPVLAVLMGKRIAESKPLPLFLNVFSSIIQIGAGVSIILLKKQLPFVELLLASRVLASVFILIGIYNLLKIKLIQIQNYQNTFFITMGFVLNATIWMLVVPALEPHRQLSMTVVQKVILKAKQLNITPHAIFDFNYALPSIPVYLSRAGVAYSTLGDFEKSFNNPNYRIFITDEDNAPIWRTSAIPIDTQTITGWRTDRGNFKTFYLVSKR